jgi:hypothetical protein
MIAATMCGSLWTVEHDGSCCGFGSSYVRSDDRSICRLNGELFMISESGTVKPSRAGEVGNRWCFASKSGDDTQCSVCWR